MNILITIQEENSHDGPLAVVVSAMGGVTDALIDLSTQAIEGDHALEHSIEQLRERFFGVLSELMSVEVAAQLQIEIEADFSDVKNILKGISIVRECSARTLDFISGMGEVWTAQIINCALQSRGVKSCWLDAREVLTVQQGEGSPQVDYKKSESELRAWLRQRSDCGIFIVTGFIARNESGIMTTLGRNGSDYSASIFGNLLEARKIVIWTDVDGVMSANPALVPDAEVIPELSYQEATEMAYFGASVLHLSAMSPALAKNIPLYVKNTFRPQGQGSCIKSGPLGDYRPAVKGFTSVSGVATLNLEGSGMIGVPGMAAKLFGILKDANISVILISQASSEHSICLAISNSSASLAKKAVEEGFYLEMSQGLIQKVEVEKDCSIVAAVGDNMAGSIGVAAKFFSALGKAGVNIHAIAQGSSERNISIIVKGVDTQKALQAAHAGLYLSHQTISIGLIGPGTVGATFVNQLASEKKTLKERFNIELRVRGICNSKKMLLHAKSLDLNHWSEELERSSMATDLEQFIESVQTNSVPHSVIIDCTSSDQLARQYEGLLKKGIHVITPNKKAGTLPYADYTNLKKEGRRFNAHFLYETTVGAGLPIIGTLRDLIQTGDKIIDIEGVFSGTLAYLFYHYDGTRAFSEIVSEAKKKGFTEPDPREDLSGMDIVRKVVILAREMGLALEVADVEVTGLVPSELQDVPVSEFMERLHEHDEFFKQFIDNANSKGEVLRYVGVISPQGKSRVELRTFPTNHPFSRIKATDNIVAFRTKRYDQQPLIVQGPGAGPEVTAAGVFADLLRLASYLGSGS